MDSEKKTSFAQVFFCFRCWSVGPDHRYIVVSDETETEVQLAKVNVLESRKLSFLLSLDLNSDLMLS